MNALLVCVEFQIAGLLKDNEKIQSNPEVPPSEDDTEIKKIKKVRFDCFGAMQFEDQVFLIKKQKHCKDELQVEKGGRVLVKFSLLQQEYVCMVSETGF